MKKKETNLDLRARARAGERVLRDYCVCRRRRRRQRSTRLVSEDFYLFADVCSVAWDGARRQSRLLKYELCYV